MKLLVACVFVSLITICSARVGNTTGTTTTTTTSGTTRSGNSTVGNSGGGQGRSSSGNSESDESYFLVNPSRSEGRPVSSEYAQRGYNSDHATNCSYRLYGVPDKRAAGDRDMRRIATSFKRQFNKLMKTIDSTVPVVMTRTEITAQQLGGVADRRRHRQLHHRTNDDGEEHDRDLAFVPYSYGFMLINYVCRGCNPDNNDKRRHLQTVVNETRFVEALSTDLKQSNSQYIGQAIESTSCLRVQCEGGELLETKGCSDFPIE